MADGVTLDYEVWGPGLDQARVVTLGIHGITANRYALRRLASAWPDDVAFVAPDLRGRGRSADIGSPFGIRQHVDDLTQLLDHLECERVHVLGHSMGAFVGAMLACQQPGRVQSLAMVDGGIPMVVPAGIDPDIALMRALGPTLSRLGDEFSDIDAYLDFWARHPAMAEVDQEYLRAYSLHDVVPDRHPLRSAAVPEAVMTDGRELMVEDEVRSASARAPVPTLLFRAVRGMLNEPTPRITQEMALEWSGSRSAATIVEVSDCNHFSILARPESVALIAGRWAEGANTP